jgi:hypothetical protein
LSRSNVFLSQGDMITRVPNQYLLVVSHDCDIRCEEEKEPFIEIIPCEKIENLEGNFSKG